jgi:rod shape-determining protein MreC
MRNIFLFIRRYFTFLLFLALQVAALLLLINYNRFYEARGFALTNEVTGWFNSKYNNVEDFFKLRDENRRLLKLNDSLMNLLSPSFGARDTSSRIMTDTSTYDTTNKYRQYIWRDAQVVYNTVTAEKNYVQINRGANQGIKDNMGVFNSDGSLVGKVINVSANYSVVMSLLHVQNTVNAMVKKTRNAGTISWDAKDSRFLTLSGISKSDSLVKGDTIITGLFSLSYPPGYMIGTVHEIVNEPSTSFYVLKIKTAANFSDLQQVMLAENIQYEEQDKLLQETRKKVDETKKTP